MSTTPTSNPILATAATLLALGVVLGVFGSHALSDSVTTARLATWETAVFYHLVHGLGLAVIGLLPYSAPVKGLNLTATCLGLGVLFFSGSLYTLVLLDRPALGMITPLGGGLFILGWARLAWQYGRRSTHET